MLLLYPAARAHILGERSRLPIVVGRTSDGCAARRPDWQTEPNSTDAGGRRGYLSTRAAPAAQITSSCDPVPPEQPTAPMILPSSINGMPPRDATTSSRLKMYLKS